MLFLICVKGKRKGRPYSITERKFPELIPVHIIAVLFLICMHSLNVPVVSYLRIFLYDCACMLYFVIYFAASVY